MSNLAQDAYLAHHAKAASLIAQLENALFDLPAPDGDILINWAHVGTVAELNRRLTGALALVVGEQEN